MIVGSIALYLVVSAAIRNNPQQEKPLIYFSLMVIVAAPAGLSGQISEW